MTFLDTSVWAALVVPEVINRGADSQSGALALMPAHGVYATKRVETSLDPAGTSACATRTRETRLERPLQDPSAESSNHV